jgi:hypothetical protein
VRGKCSGMDLLYLLRILLFVAGGKELLLFIQFENHCFRTDENRINMAQSPTGICEEDCTFLAFRIFLLSLSS